MARTSATISVEPSDTITADWSGEHGLASILINGGQGLHALFWREDFKRLRDAINAVEIPDELTEAEVSLARLQDEF